MANFAIPIKVALQRANLRENCIHISHAEANKIDLLNYYYSSPGPRNKLKTVLQLLYIHFPFQMEVMLTVFTGII